MVALSNHNKCTFIGGIKLKRKDKIFAHRAKCGCFLGNTIEGVQCCLNMGLNLEIDVQACQNGLMVTHCEKLRQDHISQYPVETVRKFGINRKDGSIVFAPATVHGRSDVARIPTLPEVLNLVSESEKEIKVILDIKKGQGNIKILDKIVSLVKDYNLVKQIIFGVPYQTDAIYIKKQSQIATLLFGSKKDIRTIRSDNKTIDYVRIWQNWLENDFGEITNKPSNWISCLQDLIHKKVIVTAGGMNEVQGGEISKGQFEKVIKLGADGIIVNDPAIYL